MNEYQITLYKSGDWHSNVKDNGESIGGASSSTAHGALHAAEEILMRRIGEADVQTDRQTDRQPPSGPAVLPHVPPVAREGT